MNRSQLFLGTLGMAAMMAAVVAVKTVAADSASAVKREAAKTPAVPREVELQGRVVCLVEETNRVHHASLPDHHQHRWGFKTDGGKHYTLLRTRYSEALFVDPRLREKELILKGRLFPDTRTLDVTSMRSMRNGVVCDLYYYCNVCSIKTIAPGPCLCCQEPVELVEKPVSSKHD
ncbi:MAG: hypothetical protein ACYDH9_07110 [Limisphaerales bacterium]